jgi:hypothetical protein
MSEMIRYDTPDTGPQLVAAFSVLNEQCTELWRQCSVREFFEPPTGGGWSTAQNVEHLIKTTSPVTKALAMPRFLLRLLFGKARIPSRTFMEVRAAYRVVLAEGAQAGPYTPNRVDVDDPGVARQRLLERWQPVLPRLTEALGHWDEGSLDYYRLPHPLLGKLTVREMLHFTLYHVGHHADVVATRRARSQGAS